MYNVYNNIMGYFLMTTALQQTAAETEPQPKKRSLSDIFNHFAAEAVERFPDLKGRLLILDMNEYAAYGYKSIDYEKTGLTPETALAYLANNSITALMSEGKEGSCAAKDAKYDLRIINISTKTNKVDEKEFTDVSEKTEKDILFILNHELAHLAIDNAYDYESLYEQVVAESIADAYALICHYQRFGGESEYRDISGYVPGRARDMVLNDKPECHFTTFVLDEIINRKHMIDFNQLNPQQTANLAWRFAMQYAPPAPIIKDMHAMYEDVRQAWKNSTKAEEALPILINTVLDPKNGYYTFKTGYRWLMYYLETRTLLNGEPINLPAEYLDDTLKKLKEREFKLAQEGILFNMPIMPAAAPQPAPANQNTPVTAVR